MNAYQLAVAWEVVNDMRLGFSPASSEIALLAAVIEFASDHVTETCGE